MKLYILDGDLLIIQIKVALLRGWEKRYRLHLKCRCI